MSSPLYSVVRKLNFTHMRNPDALRKAQRFARDVGAPEVAAAARWAVAGGLVLYWMIEPNFEGTTDSA